MGMFSEFREFAVKGNAVDMAVGIIIGGAFGKIVTSLVNDVIMPPIGCSVGNGFRAFSSLCGAITTLDDAKTAECRRSTTASFSTRCSTFIIVAFCMFLVVRQMNRVKKRDAAGGRADHQGVPAVSFDHPAEGEAMCPLHVAAPTMSDQSFPPHKPKPSANCWASASRTCSASGPAPRGSARFPARRRAKAVAARRRR